MIRSTLTNNSGEEFSYVSARPIEIGIPTFVFFHATGFNGQTYWQLIDGLTKKYKAVSYTHLTLPTICSV